MADSAALREGQLPQLVTKGVDMSPERISFAIEVAKKGYISLLKNDLKYWQEVAQMLKEELDAAFEGTWHVIVGQHFGAFVTHEARQMIYFAIGQVNFLIYKHG
ncbi:putative dynein light chain [Neospora caninum Liverpool]|uniref:Dynein light chain n=1 Tax=Neospora caninum (strain Liverpool) TaxID=572307 RepID=F0VRN1_NEOCL|nr:putative dynein light chain [Neospora caninum Liverpool]CBZ56379.1 putative dynein light chain [Neospora caninum Liverpool]CEL71139.1 TPA: dynein light chain, putative [Neospora caninum Liverpool]|eukprot:XP_003886404.1 putative dynein light chain [Neospora caninum Liverpool]